MIVATMQTCKVAGISLPSWFKIMRLSQGSHLTPQSFLIHMRSLSHKHKPNLSGVTKAAFVNLLYALFPVRVATSRSGLTLVTTDDTCFCVRILT